MSHSRSGLKRACATSDASFVALVVVWPRHGSSRMFPTYPFWRHPYNCQTRHSAPSRQHVGCWDCDPFFRLWLWALAARRRWLTALSFAAFRYYHFSPARWQARASELMVLLSVDAIVYHTGRGGVHRVQRLLTHSGHLDRLICTILDDFQSCVS